MLEKDIQRACIEFLHLKKIFCWRNNTGAFVGEYKGKTRFLRYGYPGSADILGMLPDGRFLAIEVKRPGNKLSDMQKVFAKKTVKNKGVYMVVHSVDELENDLIEVL